MAFLKVCIQGYSDGFERMDHAMNPKNRSPFPPSSQEGGQGVGPNPLAKPLTIPPSS